MSPANILTGVFQAAFDEQFLVLHFAQRLLQALFLLRDGLEQTRWLLLIWQFHKQLRDENQML